MAIQHKIFVRGKLGPVIFYERDGVGYARAAPSKVRQTAATRESAKLFGKAARISKGLRYNTDGLWPGGPNRNAMHRLNSAVLKWLMEGNANPQDDIHLVTGFEFNLEREINGLLKFRIGTDFTEKGKVNITIPAFELPKDVRAPANTVELYWHILVNSCRVSDCNHVAQAYQEIRTPYRDGPVPQQKISVPFDAGQGCITAVVVALRFSTGNPLNALPLQKKEWMPMQIVAACYR